MKLRRVLMVLVVTGALLWGAYYLWGVQAKLVTLNVRNMEVRKVVKKIEWQTWERILVNKNVSGKVTLKVHRIPLADALDIIAIQSDTTWTRLYPLYASRGAAASFRKVVLGEQPPSRDWLNLQKMAAWQRSGAGGFANTTRAANQLVSAQFFHKDLNFAALALSRFSKAAVVPEDGPGGAIDLKLEQVPFDKAVAKVAKLTHRKWERFYTLQPLGTVALARSANQQVKQASGAGNQVGQTNRVVIRSKDRVVEADTNWANLGPTNQVVAQNPVDFGSKDLQSEAFLATLTPEERKQVESRLAAEAQLSSLPPAERQQRMQEMAAQATQAAQGDLEQRIQNRLKNGTVEWRVAHDRSQVEKQRRAQTP